MCNAFTNAAGLPADQDEVLDLGPNTLEFADNHDFKRGLTGATVGGWQSSSTDAADGDAAVAHGVDTDAIWVELVFGRDGS